MAAYELLHASAELQRRSDEATARLSSCELCPRRCRVNRLEDERGVCGAGRLAPVGSFSLHFGEEAPLAGESGSGTIFFAGCNLGCCFCQNWDISSSTLGATEATPEQLAGIMLSLARDGAANINLVTPSHVVPQFLEALVLAAGSGLDLPVVYNSSGYDAVETLQLLDEVVDIYMPDVKFADPEIARRFCRAPDYPDVAWAAVQEMHQQVGDLELDDANMAVRGLLVRHLVMPKGAAGTELWMRRLASLSRDTYVNLMDQYRPCGPAAARPQDFPELSRAVSRAEYAQAVQAASNFGLTRLDDREERMAYVLRRLLG